MADNFLNLSADDRREALNVASSQSGRPLHILEKDVMVVWTVDGLFKSAIGKHLVFKGGTSLSKGYGIIKRFSEDIDVTYDVRELIPELASGETPLPATNSQADKWRKAVDQKLPEWVKTVALPILQKHAETTGIKVNLTTKGSSLYVDYEEAVEGYGYVPARVMVEFGARSTGEPAETKNISCDAASHVEGLIFPTANPRLMVPKRTFWEKATAVHVYSKQDIANDAHISRHWHDLVRLDQHGFAEEALNDRALGHEVAAFKSKFFREKDRNRDPIDYEQAIQGILQLVPTRKADLDALNDDYKKMTDAGFLLDDDGDTFARLIEHCRAIEKRANN